VKRGGSWNNNANNCTVSNRNNNNATNTNNNIGFRCISIFEIRICSARMADHERGNPDFYPAPEEGQRERWLHGLVALSNSPEADFISLRGGVVQCLTIQLYDDR